MQHRDLEDDMVVLHWNEHSAVWEPVRWDDWMAFRGYGDNFRPLLGVREGDHYFVVCVVDEERTLYNILPHRYRIDRDGQITNHEFDDLTADDRAFVSKWNVSHDVPTGADGERFDSLRGRMWRSWLPPKDAASILIQNLPGFPATDDDRPVLSFLREFGMQRPGSTSRASH